MDRTCVDFAVPNRIHNGIVRAAEAQIRKVAMRVNAVFLDFSPHRIPTGKSLSVWRHERLALEVGYKFDVLAVGPGNDRAGARCVSLVQPQVRHRGDSPHGAVFMHGLHILRRVDQNEIHVATLDCRADLIKAEWNYREGISRDFRCQIIGCWSPLL